MESSYIIIAALVVFALVAIGAIIILWAVMPLSVFGMKELLQKCVAEQEKTNRLLQAMIDSSRTNAFREPEEVSERTDNLH